jgi:hypothetical protein
LAYGEDSAALSLSRARFERLAARVEASLDLSNGRPRIAALRPGDDARFFASRETFSILHLCNHWTAGVLNAGGATLEGNKLTLTGVSGNVIVFADRPVRAAGHETTELFISRWADGNDSFSKDPPNATVSVLGGEKDGVTDAVVVLKNPKLDGTNLVFDVDVLEGDLKGLKGPAAVFIDWFAAGGRGFAVGGGGWHGGYHAWYGAPVAAGVAAGAIAGAAIGAAAAAPYYAAPACGYYPYPPCY